METVTSQHSPGSATLRGIRVAIARAPDEAHTPGPLLQELGAEVVYYPCEEIAPPPDVETLDQAVRDAAEGAFDWLVLNTASAAIMLAQRLEALGLPEDALAGVQVAAQGANTRLAAREMLHVDVDRVPETDTPEELVAAMQPLAGARILWPRAATLKMPIDRALEAAGATVVTVVACHDRLGQGGDEVPVMLWEGKVDAITFTSANNVRHFARRLRYEGGDLAMLDHVCVACIEPITAAMAQSYGLHVDVVPAEHTLDGLVSALAGYFRRVGV
ncbi:uroporphyrinogen-III synthase [Litorilinea aerophila]|uniref:Uroporphyrinogen-III synthase n=1 Tax=Litorilinea aerophila TaxID=1204385 RepID=A0A540VB26_9CHLR|nr:uroporphyrinogen-III synthase [Litorilinea aerophila]MCC9078239.1 uroporphyrinogen-III synthase [Litorilinea aerophila]